MNPMMTQLNAAKLSPLKDMMNTVAASGNPMMMLNRMAANNPAIRQALNYVNANGGDAQAAFYQMAKERGVDPESILRQLV